MLHQISCSKSLRLPERRLTPSIRVRFVGPQINERLRLCDDASRRDPRAHDRKEFHFNSGIRNRCLHGGGEA